MISQEAPAVAAARAPVKEAPVAEAGEDVTRESALPYSTPSEPILRTAEDEELDKEESLARRLTDSHLDWPNEAGFTGLSEHRGPIELAVHGHIPSWAAGSLYRVGPGEHRIEDAAGGKPFETSHWFDGFAQAHRFEIIAPTESGAGVKVLYSSRRQSDEMVENIRRSGNRGWVTFGQRQDPCVGLFGKLMSAWRRPPRDISRENISACITRAPKSKGLEEAVAKDAKAAATGSTGAADGTPSSEEPVLGDSSAGHRHPQSDSASLPLLLMTTDNDAMKLCDPVTLEPVGLTTQAKGYHPSLSGPTSCSHSMVDPDSGDTYNFNLMPGKVGTYRVFRVSASTGEAEILATVVGDFKLGPKPAYIHSFFMSENFVILCIPSSHYSWGGAKILWTRNLCEALDGWDDGTHGLKDRRGGDEGKMWQWIVVDRRHGQGIVGRFVSPPGFFFHAVNAYEQDVVPEAEGLADVMPETEGSAQEEGGEKCEEEGAPVTPKKQVDIICDMVSYNSFEVVKTLFYEVLLDRDGGYRTFFNSPERAQADAASLTRFRLRLDMGWLPTTTSSPPPLDASLPAKLPPAPFPHAEPLFCIPAPHAGELPTINPQYVTKKHRYIYSLPDRGLSTLSDGLVKTDTETRTALFWNNKKAHSPGEGVFIARPPSFDGEVLDEDDGVLLSLVLDGVKRSSYLVCIDAKTMTEMGRAEADFPIALGFHGCHVAA